MHAYAHEHMVIIHTMAQEPGVIFTVAMREARDA